jgi:hypothetical protein
MTSRMDHRVENGSNGLVKNSQVVNEMCQG